MTREAGPPRLRAMRAPARARQPRSPLPGSARPRTSEHRGGASASRPAMPSTRRSAPPCHCGRRSRTPADALRVLKRHYKLVILSNVHRDGFAASNRKLGGGVRRDLHRRGRRLLQAGRCELRVPPRAPEVGPRDGQGRHPAHRAKPAPRPCPGEALRPRQRLDSTGSACRREEAGGATEKVEAMPATDFVFFSMGRDGRSGQGGGGLTRGRPARLQARLEPGRAAYRLTRGHPDRPSPPDDGTERPWKNISRSQ